MTKLEIKLDLQSRPDFTPENDSDLYYLEFEIGLVQDHVVGADPEKAFRAFQDYLFTNRSEIVKMFADEEKLEVAAKKKAKKEK